MKTLKLTRRRLAAKPEKLAKEMFQIGCEMRHYGGFGWPSFCDFILQSWARSVDRWAKELRK